MNKKEHKTAYIALGGNMGKTEEYIEKALKEMNSIGIEVEKVSNLIKTSPYGVTDQADFINGACKIKTEMEPEELLKNLLAIEAKLDRKRIIHWGPRTIDLDIIYYEDRIIDEENLKVPHPDMQNRDFVLRPLMELCPQKIHPVFKKTTEEMLELLKKAN